MQSIKSEEERLKFKELKERLIKQIDAQTQQADPNNLALDSYITDTQKVGWFPEWKSAIRPPMN
tara:strand:+ start:406 stop:597 length:192 start_codon:yes stop_codon:yes gene_type:complete